MNRVDEIKTLHGEIVVAVRTSLEKAIRIGELLTQQKAELGHGKWCVWVLENLEGIICPSTARNYMRVFRRQDEFKTVTLTDLTQAYELLREESEDAFPEDSPGETVSVPFPEPSFTPEDAPDASEEYAPQADPPKPADDPPSHRKVTLELSIKRAEEFNKRVGKLLEMLGPQLKDGVDEGIVVIRALRIYETFIREKRGEPTLADYLRRKMGDKPVGEIFG